MDQKLFRKGFALRLSPSLLSAVRLKAQQEYISINHFIEIAVAEKNARFEVDAQDVQQAADLPVRQPFSRGAPLRASSGSSSVERRRTS